jgi:hypothetical protein
MINDNYRLKVIPGDPVTKFDASEQIDHHKLDNSGNANDLLNEISSKLESEDN